MVILAIYYNIADVVMLGQCLYYRGFAWGDKVDPPAGSRRKRGRSSNGGEGNGAAASAPDERTGLLRAADRRRRRGSDWSDTLIHVNPVLPVTAPSSAAAPPSTALQKLAWNGVAVLMVIAAGVAGWFLSRGDGNSDGGGRGADDIRFDLWGQVFGWLCAALYLGSRLPQLLLNYRRKSTEGVSMLFFLFACLGNLTYVLSIFAFDPKCWDERVACAPGDTGRVYWRYILVNASWLAGSLGTLFLDMGIFAQFFIYNNSGDEAQGEGEDEDEEHAISEADEDEEESENGDRWDQRPVLERNQSAWSN